MSAPGRLRPVSIAMIAILSFGIAGCGGSSGSAVASQAASTSPTSAPPSESATATPSAEASESDEPSAASGTLCTTGGSAASGAELTITSPDFRMHLPGGWQPMPIEQYGQLLAQAAASLNDPRVTKAADWQAGLISVGVMHSAASGVSEPSGYQASLVVSVLPLTADLQTTVDIRLNDEAVNGVPIKVPEVGETSLPIGPAYCAGLLSDMDIGTPSQTIEYIALHPGGQAISLAGTAPLTDTGFPDIVRSIALSLAAD